MECAKVVERKVVVFMDRDVIGVFRWAMTENLNTRGAVPCFTFGFFLSYLNCRYLLD